MSVRTPIEPPQADGHHHEPGGPRRRSGGGLGLLLIPLAVVIAVVLVGTVIMLTGGDTAEDTPLGDPADTGQAAPVAPPATPDPQATTKAEVIAAYRGGWDAQLAVGRDPKATADDDRLRAHLTGTSLVAVQKTLLEMKANNEVYDGEVKLLSPTVTELTPSTASIVDCVDDATGTVDAVTGERVAPATRAIKRANVKLTKIDGFWKQSNYSSVDASCAGS